MITIQHTQFRSNQDLAAILNVMTKVKMLDICKKLDLYVSPNLKKGKRPILAYCCLRVEERKVEKVKRGKERERK